MTQSTQFEVTGFKELQDLLTALPDDLAAGVIKKAFYNAAVVVKKAAQENCPVSDTALTYKGKTIPAGGLLKSIRIARPTKKQSLRQDMLLYILKAGGRAAPYAWLVEFGSGARHQNTSGGGKKGDHAGRFTGIMPPNPFMRKAIDEKATAAIDAVQQFCHDGITKAAVELAKRLGALK